MAQEQIIHDAIDNLKAASGLTMIWHSPDNTRDSKQKFDGEIELSLPGTISIRLSALVKKEIRQHQLSDLIVQQEFNSFLLIVTQRLFPKIKEQLRLNGLAYLERNGNLYFQQDGLFILIDSNKPYSESEAINNRAFSKTGLKVVYLFLVEPQWLNKPYRQIADCAHVGLGNISIILNGLKQEKFLVSFNDNEVLLNNKKELIDRWITGYKENLKPKLSMGKYRFAEKSGYETWKGISLQPGTWWGGEPAADITTNYLKPEVFTIYTVESKPELMLKYRLVPDPDGYIHVYQAFWSKQNQTSPLVNPLLIYADLIMSGDPRCTETAMIIYNEFL